MDTPLRRRIYEDAVAGEQISTGKARDAFVDAVPLNIRGQLSGKDLEEAFAKVHKESNCEQVSFVNSPLVAWSLQSALA